MTSNLSNSSLNANERWMQLGFYAVAVLFNLCLIVQVFTVGVAYFYDPAWWAVHVWLVRGYAPLSLLLWGWSLVTLSSPKIQRLTVSLPVLLVVQFCSIHLKIHLHLEVLHPLIGFTLFYISSTLVHQVERDLWDTGTLIGSRE